MDAGLLLVEISKPGLPGKKCYQEIKQIEETREI